MDTAKKFLVLFLAFLGTGIIFSTSSAPKNRIQNAPIVQIRPEIQSFEGAQASIQANNLKKHVYYLASSKLEGRMEGERGNNLAAEYIVTFFKKNNLPVSIQRFANSQNIITWVEGLNPNEVIVIGAHYDHIGKHAEYSKDHIQGIHPGADDNASGTSAVMEMAKACSKLKPNKTMVFILFSGEELGMRGSSYYVKHPLFPINAPSIKNHIFMLNLDMIGYYKSQHQSLEQITYYGSSGGESDHMSFFRAGVPCAFVFTGLHQYYHTVQDTADKLNYEGMEKITKYAFQIVWNIQRNQNSVKSFFREEYKVR